MQNDSAAAYVFGQFAVLPTRRLLLNDGEPVKLGSRALDILIHLARRAGEVVSKEELMMNVWPNTVVEEGSLRVHMVMLRKALGEDSSGVRYITNVPLRGYCLVAPVTATTFTVPSPDKASVGVQSARSGLPGPLVRLIGREEVLAGVVGSVSARRLVTIVGAGGMGKTSVAIQAAARLRAGYRDGVGFIDLAAVADASLVASAVAGAVGAPLHSGDIAGDVTSWLSQKSMLLVLDNCEHVASAVAVLVEAILGAAANVHLLATSREPLRARGEWLHRLAPLSCPPHSVRISYADALQYPAFELFVERAAALNDGRQIAASDVDLVAAICRRLDGMPLAIELVAAQLRLPDQEHLPLSPDDRLTIGPMSLRDLLPPGQRLRATLDWSYRLLSEAEQRVLRSMSVFRERFTVAGATAVLDDDDIAVVRHLMILVNKSLLSVEPSENVVHYRLLETTRAYALELLDADPEREAFLRRHALYCRAMLEVISEDVETLVPSRWRDLHGRKIEDLRAALRWALEGGGDFRLGAELLAESSALWFGLWLFSEYMQRLSGVMSELPDDLRGGRLDMRLGVELGQAAAAIRGSNAEGVKVLRRSVEIAARLGKSEASQQLTALWALFGVSLLQGENSAALEYADQFGAVARGSPAGGAVYIFHRIKAHSLHFLGRQDEALLHIREALNPQAGLVKNVGRNSYQFDHRTASLTLLARVLWLKGNAAQAVAVAAEAVETAQAIDHPLSLAYALAFSACPIALWCGDLKGASVYTQQLDDCTHDSAIVFWQSWVRVYRLGLERKSLPARHWATLSTDSLQPALLDMLATLDDSLLTTQTIHGVQQGRGAWCSPEVIRIRGELLLQDQGNIAGAEAEACFARALAIADSQGAVSWKLRAALSLARLLNSQGKGDIAIDSLRQSMSLIAEPGRTSDYAEAERLIAKLSR
ncbi:MAG: winged helix-turn-helix domain-containing protein [Polaromonas sp.]|nr:winged helix-turn-helix domain-containing protein [Polaromonas sp.]